MKVQPLNVEAAAAAAGAIGACVQTMLGPSVTLKAVVQEDGSGVLTSDVAALVGALRVQHPIGAILEELCAAQAEDVGSGLTTLVSLFAALMLGARDLAHLGVRVEAILRGFDACVQLCERALAALRTPSSALLGGDAEYSTHFQSLEHVAFDADRSGDTPPLQAPPCAAGDGGGSGGGVCGSRGGINDEEGGDDEDEFSWFLGAGSDEVEAGMGLAEQALRAMAALSPPEASGPTVHAHEGPATPTGAIATGGDSSVGATGGLSDGALRGAHGAQPAQHEQEDELALLANSLAHGRGAEMALAAAAARALGLGRMGARRGGRLDGRQGAWQGAPSAGRAAAARAYASTEQPGGSGAERAHGSGGAAEEVRAEAAALLAQLRVCRLLGRPLGQSAVP